VIQRGEKSMEKIGRKTFKTCLLGFETNDSSIGDLENDVKENGELPTKNAVL
jgi:hypothetical protein